MNMKRKSDLQGPHKTKLENKQLVKLRSFFWLGWLIVLSMLSACNSSSLMDSFWDEFSTWFNSEDVTTPQPDVYSTPQGVEYELPVYSQNLGEISSLTVSPDFETVIGASEFGIFLFESMDDLTSQQILIENPRDIVISPQKESIAWISDSTNINIMDLSTKGIAPIIIDGGDAITSLTYSSSGNHLAFSSTAKDIQVYDINGRSKIRQWSVPEWMTNITYSPDGSEIAAASLSNFTLYLFNSDTGEINRTIEYRDSIYSNLYGVYISPTWRNIAWVSKNEIQIMDMDTEDIGSLMIHEDFVSVTVWSPNGKYISSSSISETNGELKPTVLIWNISDGSVHKEIVQKSSIQNITFSSDGSQIAVFDFEGNINIWDID
jgi:hypothetical protein